MARTIQQLNYSAFTGGLITEASPLTFPDGASISESNFELTKQGFRRRRLGLGAVSNEVTLASSVTDPQDIITFLWNNNGTTGQEFLAVAARNELLIYDVTGNTPGDKLVYRTTIQGSKVLSLTAHSGQLIVASGSQEITIITSLGDNVFSERTERLYIRDRLGIPDYSKELSDTRRISLLNAAKAGKRPTPNELYLEPMFEVSGIFDGEIIDETPSPTTPLTITYNFVGKKQLSSASTDGETSVQHQLTCSSLYPAFQGYPIENFILTAKTSDVTTYSLTLIFRDGFYNRTILSPTLVSGGFVLSNGISYHTVLTQTEYTNLFNLSVPLLLNESNYSNHPHLYNLWNQGWGERRMIDTGSTELIAPIDRYVYRTNSLPANADDINSVLYPSSQESSNRTADRFHPKDLEANPQGSSIAPQGRYIIDALDRGSSRASVYNADLVSKGEFTRAIKSELSYENTSGGASTIAEYAGRVWFAGFSGDTAGSTIKLSNKILYGQTSDDNLLSCYQEADPTSKEDPTLVDTDGGWVSIDAVDDIVRLVPTDTALIVFATNGVWAIAGVDGNTFTPTKSMVLKITDKGSVNSQSVVQVDSNIFFWAKDGLYQIVSKGYASFEIVPMTKSTINSLVLDFTEEDFQGMSGAYDERLDRVVWIITGGEGVSERRELVYHIAFQSFTINTFYKGLVSDEFTEVLSVARTPQFYSAAVPSNLVSGLDNIISETDNVVAGFFGKAGKPSRVAYLSVRTTSTNSYLFFSDFVNEDFKDWGTEDATAYLVTGYVTGGDTSRMKSVPSLTLHFNRTETNATLEGVANESSCLVQSQWEWTSDPYANKWGAAFQGYRLPRPQISGIGEPVAQGIDVVTTKNKLRGRGHTVSLKYMTESGKDCQLLGWSMLASANNNV